jgi:hypothetical protein
MPLAVDMKEDLIEMPFVSGPGVAPPYLCYVQVTELLTPAPDRFVADQRRVKPSHHPKADCKRVVETHYIRDEFPRKPRATVRVVGRPDPAM